MPTLGPIQKSNFSTHCVYLTQILSVHARVMKLKLNLSGCKMSRLFRKTAQHSLLGLVRLIAQSSSNVLSLYCCKQRLEFTSLDYSPLNVKFVCRCRKLCIIRKALFSSFVCSVCDIIDCTDYNTD